VDQQATILWIVHWCHRQLYHRKNGLKCCTEFAQNSQKWRAEFANHARRNCNFLAQNSNVPTRDSLLILQDVHSLMPHLSLGTVCLQKSCYAIRNIVLKDILRHSRLIAVTRPSDRYVTSASVAFCRHIWCSINVPIVIIIILIIVGN